MHHQQIIEDQQQRKRRAATPLHSRLSSSSIAAVVCCSAWLLPTATQALSGGSTMTMPLTPSSVTNTGRVLEQTYSWTDEFLSAEKEEDEFTYDFQLHDLQDLQRSLGSEVMSSELQRQIDSAALKPDLFLDAYMQDASMMEKVAMSTMPQQLPKPAVKALGVPQGRKKKTTLNQRAARVTPEEELALGRQIQNGVALHKVKTDFEAQHGREITRQEWCDLAGLESAKELRRQVSAYRQAKQKLVESNMGLVHAVVKNLRQVCSYEEMVQEGSLGLLRAAELFDPTRGLRFSTYATIWIKGILSNSHLKEPITLPQREKTKWNRIRQAQESLTQQLGRDPTKDEVAKESGLTLQDVIMTTRRMTTAQQVLSLDYEYSTQSRSGAEMRRESTLQLDKAFMSDVDLAERTQFHADVVATLANNLDAREARLMRLRYGLVDGQTRSIQECADAMGLSKTRVQQLAKSCLKKLREAADAESLQEYLLTIA